MNPKAMNQGYRRLFWGTFFMLLWGGSDTTLPFLPGIIGLCCCLSGTGIICAVSENRRFFLARRWTQIGIGVWILQILVIVPFLSNAFPGNCGFFPIFWARLLSSRYTVIS